jgi:hypothetical protein
LGSGGIAPRILDLGTTFTFLGPNILVKATDLVFHGDAIAISSNLMFRLNLTPLVITEALELLFTQKAGLL